MLYSAPKLHIWPQNRQLLSKIARLEIILPQCRTNKMCLTIQNRTNYNRTENTFGCRSVGVSSQSRSSLLVRSRSRRLMHRVSNPSGEEQTRAETLRSTYFFGVDIEYGYVRSVRSSCTKKGWQFQQKPALT